MPRPTPTRRAFLAGGLGAVLAAAGCGSDPTLRPTPAPGTGATGSPVTPGGSPVASPRPTTLAVAGAAQAARLEESLAARAVGLLARSGKTGPSSRQRRILGLVRDAHLAHLAALTAADPTRPIGTLAPAPRATRPSGDTDAAIAALAARENAAAKAHRARITGPAGDVVLLWTSLTAAAQSYATALGSSRSRSATPRGTHRQTLPPLTETGALEQLLAQVYACLYGYQAAVPFLAGDAGTVATTRITDYYRLRDRLTTLILAGRGDPPAADPTYTLSPRPTGATSAGRLLAGVETRVQPFLGQWVRTATGTDRSTALARLLATVDRALGLGGPLDRWPGWPS